MLYQHSSLLPSWTTYPALLYGMSYVDLPARMPPVGSHAPVCCRRQVFRWAKQYNASVPQPSPAVLQLIDWLQGHIPAEDAAPPAPAVVHGDYRLDNLVFDEQLQVG